MNLVIPLSERTSSPILRSLISFWFPELVVIKVSKPKHDPFFSFSTYFTGILPEFFFYYFQWFAEKLNLFLFYQDKVF